MSDAEAMELLEQRRGELEGLGFIGVMDVSYRPTFFVVTLDSERRHRQATLTLDEMRSDRWRKLLEARLGG